MTKRKNIFIALIIFGFVLGINIFLNSLSPDGPDPVSRNFSKIQRGIGTIRAASETSYDKNNHNYVSKLSDLENEQFKLPLIKSTETGEIYNYDYCVTDDKKNYGIGVQLKIPERGPYAYMNLSISQVKMPCLPNPSKICGIDNYYCIIGNPS